MPNPYDGNESTVEQDASFNEIAGRYMTLLGEDKRIIENLPLNFEVKQDLYTRMLHVRTLQRYADYHMHYVVVYDIGDALLMAAGLMEATALARQWGYRGAEHPTPLLAWLNGLMQVNRERLRGLVPSPQIPPEEM